MDKNRETALPGILTAYQDLCDEANGVQQISVQTAVPLSEAEEKALQEAFEKKLKAKIRLKTAVDKSLIGGIKVQIDDTLYDASLSQQLHALKQTLSVE
jgi:F-type H+-transporting ATPase subunit delta